MVISSGTLYVHVPVCVVKVRLGRHDTVALHMPGQLS